MPTWPEVRTALQDAVVTASGLAGGKVIWAGQDGNAPSLPYVTLSITSVLTVGQDSIRDDTDLSRPAGQEVELEVLGVRELALSIVAFTAAPVASTGVQDAAALADKIRSRLTFESVRLALCAKSISIFDLGPVQPLPILVANSHRGRASLDVRCYVSIPGEAGELSEYVSYIDTVNGEIEAANTGAADIVRPFTAP
jgi:hypothetical protein